VPPQPALGDWQTVPPAGLEAHRSHISCECPKFTFEHFQGTNPVPAGISTGHQGGGVQALSELPVVLIVEDEYPLQGIVEDALTEGGFETDILSSGEEALTLFKGKTKNFKALVADVNLKGRMSGWEVARQIREIDPGARGQRRLPMEALGGPRKPIGSRRSAQIVIDSPSRPRSSGSN
jgi:CheY-like chemotaxis protein